MFEILAITKHIVFDPLQCRWEFDALQCALLEDPIPHSAIIRVFIHSENLKALVEFHCFEILALCKCSLGNRSE